MVDEEKPRENAEVAALSFSAGLEGRREGSVDVMSVGEISSGSTGGGLMLSPCVRSSVSLSADSEWEEGVAGVSGCGSALSAVETGTGMGIVGRIGSGLCESGLHDFRARVSYVWCSRQGHHSHLVNLFPERFQMVYSCLEVIQVIPIGVC